MSTPLVRATCPPREMVMLSGLYLGYRRRLGGRWGWGTWRIVSGQCRWRGAPLLWSNTVLSFYYNINYNLADVKIIQRIDVLHFFNQPDPAPLTQPHSPAPPSTPTLRIIQIAGTLPTSHKNHQHMCNTCHRINKKAGVFCIEGSFVKGNS